MNFIGINTIKKGLTRKTNAKREYETTDKCNDIINNIFLGINFNTNQKFDNFIDNMDNFIEILSRNTNITEENINNAVGLIEEMQKYIYIHRDEFLKQGKRLNSIKNSYMRIHDHLKIFEKRSYGNKSINSSKIEKLIKEFKENNYYLFIPPNSKELPKNINPSNIVNNIIKNKDIFSDEKKCSFLLKDIKSLCKVIINNENNILDNLDSGQLSQLKGSIEFILEEINNFNEENIDLSNSDINIMHSYKIGNGDFFLKQAQSNVNFEITKREMPVKIREYTNIINDYTPEILISNINDFGNFNEMFRTLKNMLIENKDILKMFEQNTIDELTTLLTQIKYLLEGILEKENNPKIINFNSEKNKTHLLKIADDNGLKLAA
ncbi:MAG: hypothetical protein PHN31_03440 [Candidatus Gracilibacteria bacterium]|nr:hypothetical protein [Candidatus Gracilibacteria bacterium]